MTDMIGTMNILADWGNFWMPPQASTIAPEVDNLFYGILWTCVFFFFLILILLVVFAWKYRYREGFDPGEAPAHNTALELTWTFVPTVIVVVIFYYGFKDFLHLAVPPPEPYEVVVSAHMWSYAFRYPNQYVDGDLYIPVDTPIQTILNSEDVIHGFYIPAFRVKKDVVPGRYNKIWFEATQVGTYDVFCTQFCGQDHSMMRKHVIVMPKDQFYEWLRKASVGSMDPVTRGRRIWEVTGGCNQCHSIDGTAGKGPTWQDLFGSQVKLADGTTVLADEEYLAYVITHPNSKPLPGFQPMMPQTTSVGLITDADVPNIIAFIKSRSKYYHPAPTTQATTGTSAATAPSAGSLAH